jgi:hypothetical protein
MPVPRRIPAALVFLPAIVLALPLCGLDLQVQRQTQDQQQQRRDVPAVRQAGTAIIAGRVVDHDTGRPLKRVQVTVTGAAVPQGASALTDADGRYTIPDLPSGRYNVNVSKAGFVTVSYGQRRPGRTGTPLSLRDGQQIKDVNFMLPRGSVIAGRVVDEDGEPVIGANVVAMRCQYLEGQQRLTPAGAGQTDDRGQYRMFALMPGNYYVSATARMPGARGGARYVTVPNVGSRMIVFDEVAGDGALDYAPTYYPGVSNVSDALIVPVNLCQEVTSVDIQLQEVLTARVSGSVLGPDGYAAASATVMLMPEDNRMATTGIGTYPGRTTPDGSFAFTGVPPGRYVAVARAVRSAQVLFARQLLSVAGQDLVGVDLALGPGATISGTVTFETSARQAPTDLSQIRITATPLTPMAGGVLTASASVSGSFTLANVGTTPQLVRATGQSMPWALKGVYLGGRDISDVAMEFKSGERITGVSVVFTDSTTEITGTVPDSTRQPLMDCLVIAFPVDSANWVPQSRRIVTSRPDENGRYHLRGLPSGDYLVIALDDADEGQWYDAALLEQLRPSAVRVALAEGETRSQDLKLVSLGR